MNDDDFSNIVRSGSEHHVSVSEHTGNAKTPKNIVVSHEEETEARKRAFEQKALADLEAKQALAAVLSEHSEHAAPNEVASDANLQKVSHGVSGKNVQEISTGSALAPNVQNVPTDVIDANLQKIGIDKVQDNIQDVSNGKSIAPNVQNVAGDVIAANRQSIATDAIRPNQQSIAGEKAIDINRQGIDNGPANAPNLQTLGQDDVATNRQSLDQDSNAKNQQGIPTDAMGNNPQQLAQLDVHHNQQVIEQSGLATNSQTLAPTPSITANKQGVGADAPSLNRQAAPENTPPDTNRQGVDNGKIESHFEPLPSSEIERKKVDFPTSTTTPSATPPAPNTSVSAAAKPKAAATMPRAPLTAVQQQQQAKLKREQVSGAFHGRLAGIKQNVDALNNRLTDFEDKVHKEDSKLEKGDPNDFQVNLD